MPTNNKTKRSVCAVTGCKKALIGMVHVRALPGTPYNHMGLEEIVDIAVEEAGILVEAGFDALIIENMHDRPYLMRDEVGCEIIAGMTRVGLAVKEKINKIKEVPFGVQILSGANKAALAVAQAVGANFIRAEGYVFASVADEGLLSKADAGELLRYRKSIGAENDIAIYADIKKKHSSHAITSDLDITQTAQAAQFFGADGVIVTGTATGEPVDIEELASVRSAVGDSMSVLVGSGVTPANIAELLPYADGLIVGSWYKKAGLWLNELDTDRVRSMVEAMRQACAD